MTAFDTTPRKRMTPQDRAAVFMAGEGCCYLCSRKIWPGERWQVEHKIALVNGGSNDADNLAPVCEWCHPTKTREDHQQAAKGRHVATKHHVHSDDLRSSPAMPGTKRSGWKRKVNGETVRR